MLSLLKKLALKITLSICTTFALLIPLNANAMPEIMPLDKVKSGMSGVAYTVIDGSGVIEPFNVDIIGLMDNGKGSTKMIMAKASGALIEKTGGVLQGMSGSPVYIDGKLIGALAAGLKEMSPYTFFITPIEDMLPLWNLPDPKAANKYQQIALKKTAESEENNDNKNVENNANNIENIDIDTLNLTLPDESAQNDKSDKSKKDKKRNDKSNNSKDKKDKSKDNNKNKIVDDESNKPAEEKKPDNEIETKGGLFFSGFDTNGVDFLTNEFKSIGMKNFYAAATTGEKRQIDYDANLEKAKALLAEAGYENGEGFPEFEYLTNDAGYHKAVAEYLQSAWAELGLTMTINIQEWQTVTADRRAGNFDVARNGWVYDWDDPSNMINLLETSNGNNDGKYSSEEFDSLVDQARKTTDVEEHYSLLHQAEQVLLDDAAMAPIAYYNDFWLQKSNLKGTWHSPYGYWYFMYGSLE